MEKMFRADVGKGTWQGMLGVSSTGWISVGLVVFAVAALVGVIAGQQIYQRGGSAKRRWNSMVLRVALTGLIIACLSWVGLRTIGCHQQ